MSGFVFHLCPADFCVQDLFKNRYVGNAFARMCTSDIRCLVLNMNLSYRRKFLNTERKYQWLFRKWFSDEILPLDFRHQNPL